MTRLIFLGPPGAGKGTQAELLSQHCGIPHISTGAILRQAVSLETELGLKAQSFMDRGELVPDQLILDLVCDRLGQSDASIGWILDGFPRNVAQAQFLNSLLQEIGQTYNGVINLDVPDEILIARLLERGRKDDNEDVIRHRLMVYREQTAPLIDFYSEQHQLFSVNGNQPIEQVTTELKNIIQTWVA